MLQKAIVTQARTNGFLLLFGLINLLICIYFYFQKPIIFEATGWFPIPENIHWYQIFLVLIILRMLISFTMKYLTEYIKNLSLWTEKKKQSALYILAAINLLTLPISLPLIGAFYAYIQNKEILFNHWFLGTFRRILTEKERKDLYEETVKNFLEKIKASNGLTEEIKKWSIENSKTMLEKYDAGSVSGTKAVFEQLEMQSKVFQKSQGYFNWMYEQTLAGLSIFNTFLTNAQTCTMAWISLLAGVTILGLIYSHVSLRYLVNRRHIETTGELARQDLRMDTYTMRTNIRLDNRDQADTAHRRRSHNDLEGLREDTENLFEQLIPHVRRAAARVVEAVEEVPIEE